MIKEIPVDSNMLIIGDPAYIIEDGDGTPGSSWNRILDRIGSEGDDCTFCAIDFRSKDCSAVIRLVKENGKVRIIYEED